MDENVTIDENAVDENALIDAKVLKPFTDKETGIVYMPDDKFSGTDSRINVLSACGFVRKINDRKKSTKTDK